jgi:PAS domain S-box-containing protein
MRFSFNKILTAAVTVVILTIVIVLFVSIRQSQRSQDTAKAVTRAEQILYHIQQLVLSVLDNETNARGYVITGKSDFLQLYKTATGKSNAELAALNNLIEDTTAKKLLIDSLSFYINKRAAFSDEIITLRDSSGQAVASERVFSGLGSFYTGQVRGIAERLQHIENKLLEEKKEKNEQGITQLRNRLYWVLAIVFFLSMSIILKVKSDVRYIIQRKKREQDLRKSEERFRLLINNVKDYAIFMLDPGGLVESWNSGAERIKGYTSEEIIGKSIDVFYTADDIKNNEPALNLEIAKKNGQCEKEGWRLRKDGTAFWANMIITAMFDEKGNLQGYAKITRDITERKKNEEQLLFLSRQVNQSNDAIYVSDKNRKLQSWNKGAENLYGFTSEEALGQDANLLLRTFITDKQIDDALKELSEKDYWTGELKRKSKAGDEIYLRASSTTIKDENGIITGYVSVNFDITERKRLEDKLKKFNEDLEEQVRQKTVEMTGFFERVTDAFIALDKDFRYVYVNKRAGELIHRDPASLLGKKVVEEYPFIVDTELYKGFNTAMASQEPAVITEFYEPLGLTLENYIYPSTEGLSFFIRDITERRKSEKELMNSYAEKQLLADRLSTILNTLPAKVALLDEKGMIVEVNEAWSNSTEKNGLIDRKYIAGSDYVAIALEVAKEKGMGENAGKGILGVLSGQLDEFVLEYFSNLPKTKKWYRMVVTPLRKKESTGAVIMHTDITEQKLSEEKIRLSEQKYKFLFDSNPMPMWMRSMEDGLIIDVNKAACDAYGYTREEFFKMGPIDLRHPDQVKEFLKEFKKDMSSPENRGIWKHRKKDNTYVDVEIYVQDIIYNKKKARLILAKDVTERLEAEKQLHQSYQEIRKLVSYLQNIREEERTNMAREIHDQLGQQLTVMKMDISWMYKKMQDAEKPVRDRMQELKDIMDDTVKLVRRLSADLRPSLLDDMGLIAAIEWHLSEMEKRSGISITLECLKEEPSLSKESKTNLFRILQESLTNVSRHAKATNVTVILEKKANDIVMTIRDNGVGFDSEKIAAKRTLGLLGMRERTSMMGGTYEISSSPGSGTTVLVSIPLPPVS